MNATPIDSLPVDKAYLHFDATRIHSEEVQVDYELVLPLPALDCRGTHDHKGSSRPKSHRRIWLDKKNNKRIPLGRTMVGTSNANYPFNNFRPEDIDLPFRDGAHASWDNERLGGLQLIYTMGDKHWLLTREDSK